MNKFQGESVGQLFIDIKARQDQFERELRRIRKKGEDTANAIEGRFAKLKNLGNNFKGFLVGAGVVAGIDRLAAATGRQIEAAFTQAKAEAAVAQAIKSTGGAAGLSAGELKEYASELQKITGIGDEVQLKDVTTQLLTFTNVTGERFKRAQAITLDLSETLGTDLKSSAIQVGKALNDPIRGLDGLGRSGIQFTEQQKEQIKTMVKSGDLFKAQSLILDELETQYGGQAEAAARAEAGTRQFWAAVGDLGEVFGAKVIKVISPAIGLLNKWLGATEEAVSKTEKVTRETGKQVEQFDKLAFAYERLRQNTSRTAAEQKLYERTIADLQRRYPSYLKNIDLEKDSYEDVSVALKEARKDLTAFLEQKIKLAVVQDLETEFIGLGKQLDQLAQARLSAQKEIDDALFGGTFRGGAVDDKQARQIIDNALTPQLEFVDTLEEQITQRQEQIKKRIADTQKAIGEFLPAPSTSGGSQETPRSTPLSETQQADTKVATTEQDAGRAVFERSVAEYRAYYDTLKFEAAGYLEYRKQLIEQEAAEIKKFASNADADQFEQKKLEELKREEVEYFEQRKFNATGYKEFRVKQINEQIEVFSQSASTQVEIEEKRIELMRDLANEEADFFKESTDSKVSYFMEAMEQIRQIQEESNNIIVSGYDAFTSSFGDALGNMIFEQQKFSDAIKQVWSDISRAVVEDIGRMIAKFLAFQALKAAASFIPGLGGVVAAAGGGTPAAQTGGEFVGTSKGVKRMATGGSFNVPAGFPNDTYPLLVETGERVSVTRAGMASLEQVELSKIKNSIQALTANIVNQQSRMTEIAGKITLNSTIEGRDLELSSARQQRLTTRLK